VDLPLPLALFPMGRFQSRSAIKQVFCLLGVDGLVGGLAEGLGGDSDVDPVVEEAWVEGGKACRQCEVAVCKHDGHNRRV